MFTRCTDACLPSMNSEVSVAALLLENARLRSKLAEVQSALDTQRGVVGDGQVEVGSALPPLPSSISCGLSRSSILRYSRHLLLSELGNHPVRFVDAVQRSSVLVIGAGGLGCPALLYLAAAGVGRLGVVDGDVVDASNLPRQVMFDDRHVGLSKAAAACARLRHVNPECAVECHSTRFTPSNAESLSRSFDVLLDCSDNVATRYLCNDISVLLGIPCVSASALRMEGQLSVYGSRSEGGPCYRCLFPLPVASHLVTNCNEGGILNAVTGVMGTLQALEALKCIAQRTQADDEREGARQQSGHLSTQSSYRCPSLSTLSGRLLLFDGCASIFRSVKLRGRSAQCAVCGDSQWRRITLDTLRQQHYTTMCSADQTASFDDNATSLDAELSSQPALLQVRSISVQSLASHLQPANSHFPYVLLDVRPSLQFDIAHLPQAINVPREQLMQRWHDVQRAVQHAVTAAEERNTTAAPVVTAAISRSTAEQASDGSELGPPRCRLFVVCRRGVDSLHAARWIEQQQQQQQHEQQQVVHAAQSGAHLQHVQVDVLNVHGGLMAWSQVVDKDFPMY